jgi:hypothetical protein
VKAQQEEKLETSTRFSEVKSISDFLGRLVAKSKRKDVLLFGDFNLMAPAKDSPLPPKAKAAAMVTAFKQAWYDSKGVLENFKDAQPFINMPSTVGKDELISEFDHFVFAKKATLAGCDTDNASVFNFTDRDIFPEGDEIIQTLKLDDFMDTISNEKKFDKQKIVQRYSDGKLNFLKIGYQNNVLDSYKNSTLSVYKELISDHLPISMNCNR